MAGKKRKSKRSSINSQTSRKTRKEEHDPAEFQFPCDILREIFKFLDGISLGRCCAVSRKWRQVALDNQLWYRLCKEIPHLGRRKNLKEQCEEEPFGARYVLRYCSQISL